MRSTYLFVAGALLGAAAMYFMHGSEDELGAEPGAAPAALERPAPQARDANAALRSVDFLTLAMGSTSVAERAAMLRLVAEAGRGELEALAAQVAALPNIEGRRLALDALFTRYAELDAPAAAAFARTLDLPPAALKPLYVTWARSDARGALASLGELLPREALTIGVALLDVLGNDGLGIARVLGAAPHVDADAFRIEAAIAKAAQDPKAALEALLELPAPKAKPAFERLAVIWTEHDVYGAIAAAEQIADEELRSELRGAVLRAWSRLDPDALVDYVADLDADRRDEALRTGVLQAVALVDPQRALRAAEGVPGQLGAMMRTAALMNLAGDDPVAALGIVEAMPPGNERDQLLAGIARRYGETDPAAALAWARASGTPGLLTQVTLGIARVDSAQAIDLVATLPPADQARMMTALVSGSSFGAQETAALADRMLALSPRGRALQTLTSIWATRAPTDALPWLLAHRDSVSSSAIPQAGLSLARKDPAAAIAYLDRMPGDLRPNWLSAVAEGYAQNDARAAAEWISRYRGERGYDAAVAAVASRAARQDPVAAARLLDSIDVREVPDAAASARTIAQSWARQDAAAAAMWARTLPSDAAAGALSAVAGQWAARDAGAARNWVTSLPPGEARDAALAQIVGATAGTAQADSTLFDAFSSAAARERAISDAARIVALRDSAVARELVDRYVTDPELRRSAERYIAPRPGPFGSRAPAR